MANEYLPPYYETCDDRSGTVLGPRHPVQVRKREESSHTGACLRKFISQSELNRGLDSFLPKPRDPLATKAIIKDAHFLRVKELLEMFGKGDWGLRPRTFVVLRMLGCPEILDDFVRKNRTDSLFPYTDSNLPDVIKGHSQRTAFLKLQQLVLYKQKDVAELESRGRHLHLSNLGDTYFESIKELGRGRYGVVQHVFSRQTLRPFARKLIHRGLSALTDSAMCAQFESEIQALKKLTHRHIVKFVGSYTDEVNLGLIMTPIADSDLDNYLRSRLIDPDFRKRTICCFFGCLASALAYLHSQDIRHNDIKPRNVLVKDSCVFLSDFGTSISWGTQDASTSAVESEGYTFRYSSPETFNTGGKRNRASDIWSLGCVFLEIATVLLDHTLVELEDFLAHNGTLRRDGFLANIDATKLWIAKLRKESNSSNMNVLDWTSDMLQYDPSQRPTAAQIRGQTIDLRVQEIYICHYCSSIDEIYRSQQQQPSKHDQNQTQLPIVTATPSEHKQTSDDMPISAEALGLPQRSTNHLNHPAVGAASDSERRQDAQIQLVHNAENSRAEALTNQTKRVCFDKLPEDRRPKPAEIAENDVDDVSDFVLPEPLESPPFQRKVDLPEASLVPSYVLACTNRLSRIELEVQQQATRKKNLFVYGRLMFPSVLWCIATRSIDGAYSREYRRRLRPASEDWCGANHSIRRASEIMTPGRLEGYDQWRPTTLNCPVIQASTLTPRILRRWKERGIERPVPSPSGFVDGFLITGLGPEVFRYLDHLFRSTMLTCWSLQPQDDKEDEQDGDRQRFEESCLLRENVEVKIELNDGEVSSVSADTYVWPLGITDLEDIWKAERFLRSVPMQSLLQSQPTWMMEEESLARIMKISFTRVGDFLCRAIMSEDIKELKRLLKQKYDANARCRVYDSPLQAAVVAGNPEAVQLLLQHKANPSALGGQYGSPLIAAAYCGRKEITQTLLQHGADVFATDNKYISPLYQAVAHLDYSVTQMLLDHGAWLGKYWGEIIDMSQELSQESNDREISGLLLRYDIRKLYKEHKRLGYVDGHTDDSWNMVSYPRVLGAVISKAIAVHQIAGSWKGQKGLAVTLAALDAGAPLRLIGLLRGATGYVKAIVQVLVEREEEQEERKKAASRGKAKDDEIVDDGRTKSRDWMKEISEVTRARWEKHLVKVLRDGG